ncbi:MAG: PEGA domain-containing protein [Treponema sp.]|nr:PEGA domain-containing protein [Treponema sp.]
MRKLRKFFTLLLPACAMIIFSCATTTEKKIDSAYVMVYDWDNSGVMDVEVFIDGRKVGKTDIYGRLSFPSGKERECALRAEKDGYETVETRMPVRAGQLLYFKMGTGAYYAEKAETLLDGNELEKALKMIDKALETGDRSDWRFLKKVIESRIKNEE